MESEKVILGPPGNMWLRKEELQPTYSPKPETVCLPVPRGFPLSINGLKETENGAENTPKVPQ